MSDCKQPGLVVPVIDRNRCEGKAACVRVCPTQVFELRRLDGDERRALSPIGRIKGFFHGYEQAFAVRADRCEACGKCVTICPEDAIKLAPAAGA